MNKKKLVESAVLKILKEAPNSRVHPKDDLLSGITMEDLIIAVSSNESVIDSNSVMRTFNDMVKVNLEDSKAELRDNMDQIIKWAKTGY